MSDIEGRVLKLVAESDYKPITLKAMSRRLHVGPEAYPEFRSVVKGLVRDGRLDIGKDKRLSKPGVAKGAIIGVFRRNARGFGFVLPHTSKSKTDQIYIPVDAGRDASSGDEVVVKITKRGKGSRLNP